jgi:hypothetical protein
MACARALPRGKLARVPPTQLLLIAMTLGLSLTTAVSTAEAFENADPVMDDASDPGADHAGVGRTTPREGIGDDVWSALEGKQVVVETSRGPVEGELASVTGETVVLIAPDGRVSSLPKRDATSVRVARTGGSQPSSSMPTTPPPATGGTRDAGADGTQTEDEAEEGETARDRRRERRENRSHALLGTFSAHGAAYAHWRGDGIQAGHAAYAMDWGVGFNATEGFGMYAMAGGLLGARIDDKQVRANYGHVAFMFAFGGKYYHSMFGAGAAFNRLRFPDDELQKDVGLALPLKIFGKIPLPHKIYLGIGLSYELGLVRNFGRAVNGIGGQIVIGRW